MFTILCAIFFGSFGVQESLSLDQFIAERGEIMGEGYITHEQTEFFSAFLAENPSIRSIAEIGFNAGHSSEHFLCCHPEISVTSFDIMIHSYSKVGKEYMDLKYPTRHTLIEGDSQITVLQFANDHPHVVFDLIFIDGNHALQPALHDIRNMKQLAGPHTLLIVDDIDMPAVWRAWQFWEKRGLVESIQKVQSKDRSWVIGRYKDTRGQLNLRKRASPK